MAVLKVKHVNRVRRGTRVYHYHRLTRERLPDDPAEAARRADQINCEIEASGIAGRPRRRPPGSLDALIDRYLAAPDYRQLAPATRRSYRAALDRISGLWGRLPAIGVDRALVYALRDSLAETPAAANKTVEVLRLIYAFALDREVLAHNPAAGVKRLRAGAPRAAWPDWAVAKFREKAPADMVLALELGLATGQRISDVAAMTWAAYDGRAIALVQKKTGRRLEIRATRALKRRLDALRRTRARTSTHILTDARGRPFPLRTIEWRFLKARKALGLEAYTFHGLRYAVAAALAESGSTVGEIAAVTGHRTLAMVQRYSDGAEQKRLAGAAIAKLERHGRRHGARTKTAKRGS
ncbi:MAG TPA: tyrosine-type recombinase/integrase [Kiloniellales bacterium]